MGDIVESVVVIMIMVNYGSNIKFAEAKNDWIATANIQYNDTIFINKHNLWKKGDSYSFKKIIAVIPHETIHSILWCEGLDNNLTYDVIRNKILNRATDRIHDFYYRCM